MVHLDSAAVSTDHSRMSPRNVVGCMTGTSMDAIDAALVKVEGDGLAIRAAVLRCVSHPLDSLADPLRRLADQEPASARQIATLSREFALRHVDAVQRLMGSQRPDLIAVHGQTVYHAPPVSWQLLTPAPMAEAFHAPVVFDLRAADLAAGGQGAPITPIADYVLFRNEVETRAIVNLGGYANYTLLPARQSTASGAQDVAVNGIRGGDICACNQLLDAIARDLFEEPFDDGGQRAADGEAQPDLVDHLVGLLRGQARLGRSLGTGDEMVGWITQSRGRCSAEDLARSASDAIAAVIPATLCDAATQCGPFPVDRVLLAGGGLKNRVLFEAIERQGQTAVQPTDDVGVPASHREAAAMAVLGALCQDRVPITLRSVTGVGEPAPLAGTWVFPRAR